MGLDLAAVEKLKAWLIDAPHVEDGGVTFARDFVALVCAYGLPVMRASLGLTTKHPELFWRSLQWTADGGVHTVDRTHADLTSTFFTQSPIALLRKGGPPIRVRLLAGPLPYPVCEDLRARGGTDYLAQGLHFSNGDISYVSWTLQDSEGFSEQTLHALDALAPVLARRLELESAYHGTRALLEVYLGPNAARRVLAGQFRRGGGERIEAAIWFCDMRGFTALSDRWPAEDVVRILDAYFDAVAGAISEHGGEVLKFIGDAILAIFPVADDRQRACKNALAAAHQALAALSQLQVSHTQEAPADPGLLSGEATPLAIGIALHVGSVLYGNIGARRRLDFTVISSAVNEASRLEALCKSLGTPLTLSEAFVQAAGTLDVVDLGHHALKGVTAPLRVFTLEKFRPPII